MKVLTTHVGSLPRSQKVVDFIFAREKNEPFSIDEFDDVMKKAVEATVKKQKDSGIDIVSDGETSKISYATYVKDRYTGFDGDSPRNAPQDLKLFPQYLKKLADDGGTPQYARPMCVGEVKSKENNELQKDIKNLKSAMKVNNVERGFMNAASPGVISLFLQNDYYPSREKYLEALAEAMKQEYDAIVAEGLTLQLDCPDLALSRHMLFNDLSDEDFIKIANSLGFKPTIFDNTKQIFVDRSKLKWSGGTSKLTLLRLSVWFKFRSSLLSKIMSFIFDK